MPAMCARRLEKSQRTDEPVPPRKVDDVVHDPSLEDEAALRLLRKNLTWKDWIVRDFLRYWYWLGAVAFDAFIPWAAWDYFGLWEGYGIVLFLVLLLVLFSLELALYFRLWPEGPWRTSNRRRRRRRFVKGPSVVDRLLRRMISNCPWIPENPFHTRRRFKSR